MKEKVDPRHISRILALQHLFEQNFRQNNLTTEDESGFSEENLCDVNEVERYDKKLYDQIIKAVKESIDEIDEIIHEYAPERPVSEISQVDLQILRIAIAEAFVHDLTPQKVAIDEAIELAKEFGGLASSKFINGVLGTLLQTKIKDNDKK
ncbi:MAG: transcription antitermination factor NusB [Candidatus Dojkabacteria bacterium]|nr:transcription antitermination factor NusB [Candidatus Dojkabacteria bacterium]